MTRLRLRLSYANVTATVALFVALGGSSYAALRLPRNSVGSAQVRNHSIKAVDLARDAVPAGARGPRGPQGPAGANGAAGPTGPRGPSDVYVDGGPGSVA